MATNNVARNGKPREVCDIGRKLRRRPFGWASYGRMGSGVHESVLLLATAAGAVRVGTGAAAVHGDCIRIEGVWYCPCERYECAPPDCEFIDGQWYCPPN
jgi:hypothetical protein